MTFFLLFFHGLIEKLSEAQAKNYSEMLSTPRCWHVPHPGTGGSERWPPSAQSLLLIYLVVEHSDSSYNHGGRMSRGSDEPGRWDGTPRTHTHILSVPSGGRDQCELKQAPGGGEGASAKLSKEILYPC